MSNLIRYILNFVISGLLVLLFRALGWIIFIQPPRLTADDFINDLLVAGIIALVIFIIGEILGFTFKIVKTIFFCAGCILSIVFFFVSGYFKLALASWLLTDWFGYRTELYIVLIISLAIGIFRLPHREEFEHEQAEFKRWRKQQAK